MGAFFVRRPIVAMVIAIVTVILGVLSLLQLPMEQYPDITPPIVQVRASYTGANATNVEASVATPLEQDINGVDNMLYMKSVNANDGTMTINVSFEIGTDPDMNTVFVQNRVSAATAKLPEEVKRLGVTTEKSLPNILMLVSLTDPSNKYDQTFLNNYALINIKDSLARLKGIGRVDVLGGSDYSMRIWIKPDRLAQLDMTVSEITNAIKAQNVIVPGGSSGLNPHLMGRNLPIPCGCPIGWLPVRPLAISSSAPRIAGPRSKLWTWLVWNLAWSPTMWFLAWTANPVPLLPCIRRRGLMP